MKKILKKLHLYIALIFFIPLVLQGLTGSILVFEKPITNFFLHQKHDFAKGEIAPVSEIIKSAVTSVPEDFNANFVRFSFEENDPAFVRFTKSAPKKSFLEVVIDPVSLEVVAVKNPEKEFFSFIKKLHTNLLIQGELGRNIIGILGIILLFMTISGIIIWWPKKMNKFKSAITFDLSDTETKRGVFFVHKSIHKAVGFWTFALMFIASFSAIYLAFPKQVTTGITKVFSGENLRVKMSEIRLEKSSENSAKKSKSSAEIDEVVALAKQDLHDAKLISVNLPMKSEQAYRLNFISKNQRDDTPLVAVFVDQNQKKIIQKFDPKFYSTGEIIVAWQPYLHEGRGLGATWKTLVFLSGFLMLIFSITGITIWSQKKQTKS